MLVDTPLYEEEQTLTIFGHLAVRQTELEEHPFFDFLRKSPSPGWLMSFIPRLGFWVHAFQDALKLADSRVSDPTMKSITAHIRKGDLGHERWFEEDMQSLGLGSLDLRTLYGRAHEGTRMASYAVLSEIFQAKDDRLLVVLLLSLESASYVFLEMMTEYLEDSEFPLELKYFGRSHLEAELEHGIVEAEMDICVESAIAECPHLRDQAHALIDRVFDTFETMFQSYLGDDEVASAVHASLSTPISHH